MGFPKSRVLATPPKGLSPTSLPHSQVPYQFQAPGPDMGLEARVGAWDKPRGVSGLCHILSSLSTGFEEVGWYPGLEQRYRQAIPNATVPNTTCHLPRSDAFHMLRDPVNGDIPWPGLIFGLTVLATWCWCTDQVMPQPGLAQPVTAWGGFLRGKPCIKMHRGSGFVPGPPQGSPEA